METFACKLCDKVFSKHFNLKRHCRNIHKDNSGPTRSSPSFKCGICNTSFSRFSEYNNHLNESHKIFLIYETIAFHEISEFEIWKKTVEYEQNSFFVKNRGNRKPLNDNITSIVYYQCHRSGYYKDKKTSSPLKRKRHIKIQGSSKINSYCPSRIKVVFDCNGKITVDFCKTHVGHCSELAHVPLPKDERKEIASKIAQKIPFDSILDDVQTSVKGEIKRKHILTKQDLRNITKEYSLDSECVCHSDDALTIESCVEQVRSSDNNCVLLYKPYGTDSPDYPHLKTEDFMLGIMTVAQKEMLKKYGHNCICIDSTHGTSDYKFEMTTLLVLDDMCQGFPCAFYFSNRNDQISIDIFLKSVRDSVGVVHPKVFMTDVAEVFYNSWKCIMSEVENRLFCTWHVQRDWQKRINQIKSCAKRKETLKTMFTLNYEVDKNIFEGVLPIILSKLCGDADTANFGKYFESNYVENCTSWAYCYRKNDDLNTNMHLERLHAILRHFYIRGEMANRLAITVHALMRFINRNLFDRLILYKGKLTSKLRCIKDRHKKSLNLTRSNVLKISGCTWAVFSNLSALDVYTVTINQTSCSCALICEYCKICIHKFNCTCIDACIKWNMCNHIHLVCQTQNVLNENNIECPKDSNGKSEENAEISKLFIKEVDSSDEKNMTMSAVSKNRAKPYEIDLNVLKQEVSDSFSIIMSKINSTKQLDVIRMALKNIEPQIEAITKGEESHLKRFPRIKIRNTRKYMDPRRKCPIKRNKMLSMKPKKDEANYITISDPRNSPGHSSTSHQ